MAQLLLIEDDQMVMRMYGRAFTAEGFLLETALDGQEGLQKAKDIKPQLILLDVMMPKMNGMEVLDNLKSDPTTKDIPVIILTNLASDKNEELALSKGAVRYLTKGDYDPAQVVKIIREILGK